MKRKNPGQNIKLAKANDLVGNLRSVGKHICIPFCQFMENEIVYDDKCLRLTKFVLLKKSWFNQDV